jgi:hypothetical protein
MLHVGAAGGKMVPGHTITSLFGAIERFQVSS